MAKRKRGGGSLHLRKDGRWEGRVVIGYDEKGLPVTKNVLARTKNECAAKLAQLREMLKEPALNQPKPGILLADWLDLWYQGYKKPNIRPNMVCFPAAPYQNFYVREEAETWRPEQETGSSPSG